MQSVTLKFCTALLALMLLCPALLSASTRGELTIELRHIEAERGGQLRVALFRGEQGWPKFDAALQIQTIPASNASSTLIFKQLEYAGDYAVEVHHDENSNGKFDMRWLPYPRPKEGVGVSNNHIRFGPPDYDAARFPIEQPATTLEIRMYY